MYDEICVVASGDVRVVGQLRKSDNTARWIIYRGAVEIDRYGYSNGDVEKIKRIARKLLVKYSNMRYE